MLLSLANFLEHSGNEPTNILELDKVNAAVNRDYYILLLQWNSRIRLQNNHYYVFFSSRCKIFKNKKIFTSNNKTHISNSWLLTADCQQVQIYRKIQALTLQPTFAANAFVD